MKAKLVRIGNSRGIRLPKAVIDEVGLTEELELDVGEGRLTITPSRPARDGWAEAARTLGSGDTILYRSRVSYCVRRIWFRATRDEWGPCGKLLYSSGRVIGYAQYAPPQFLPNAAAYEAGPPSPEATFLSCLFLPDETSRRQGLGRLLLESILCELRARGMTAVETFARKGSQENPSGPLEFYLRQGFAIVKDDPMFPLVQYKLSHFAPPAARAA